MVPRVVPMIHVPDVRATAAWYEGIGFSVRRTHEDEGFMSWALLTFGATELMLNEGGTPSTAFRREVDLYVYVEDLADLRSRLDGRVERLEIVEDVHDTVYGMRELIVRDVNGFWITFGQPVAPAASTPA